MLPRSPFENRHSLIVYEHLASGEGPLFGSWGRAKGYVYIFRLVGGSRHIQDWVRVSCDDDCVYLCGRFRHLCFISVSRDRILSPDLLH